jgi:hypothetical protein
MHVPYGPTTVLHIYGTPAVNFQMHGAAAVVISGTCVQKCLVLTDPLWLMYCL